MAGVQIGALHVSLSADSAAFDQNMQQAQEVAEEAMGSISETAIEMAGALAAAWASISSIDAIITATKEQIDYADSLGDVAARSNQAAEALSAYEYALAFSDASLQDYTAGLQKLEQNMAAASEGSKEQALVFETLGIQLREQDGMLRNSGDVMLDFADVLAGMANGATKTQLAMDVLGKSAGPALLPFLSQGKEGIEEFTAEAERMGLVVSTEFSDAAGQLNDNLDKLGSVTTGLWRSFADGLTPALVDVSNAMIQAAQDADYFKKVAKDFGELTGEAIKSGYKVYEAVGIVEVAITETLKHDFEKFKAFVVAMSSGTIDSWEKYQSVMADTSAMEKVGAQIEKTKKLWHEMTEEEKAWAAWKKQEDALFADLAENTQKYAALAYEESKKRIAEEQAAQDKAAKAAEEAAKKTLDALKKQQEAIDRLAQSFMTETEKQINYYNEQEKLLKTANAKAFEYAGQRHKLLEQLETEHINKMLTIRRAAIEAEYEGGIIQLQFDTQQEADLEAFGAMIDQMLIEKDAAEIIDSSNFTDMIDTELLAMDAANVYKKNAQDDFIAAFIQGDLDRVNAVITNGDAELEARKAQMQATVGFFNQGLAQMAQGQGKAAKAAQAIQKAQALYEIGVNTYRAAVGAYAALSPIPFVGPALGVAAAAAAIAFGGSMAQGVLSGGSPSVTGGAPPALPASSSPTSQAEQRAEQPTLTTYVRIPEDAILTGRKMLDFIDEAMGDGKQLTNLRFIPA